MIINILIGLLNIRGTDIDYNPVVISYAIVTKSNVMFFVDAAKITEEVRAHLEGVTILPYLIFTLFTLPPSLCIIILLDPPRYESFFDELRKLKKQNKVSTLLTPSPSYFDSFRKYG